MSVTIKLAFVIFDSAIGFEGTFVSALYFFVPFILILLFSGIIRVLFLDIPLLEHACETLEISNAAALEEVAQSSAAVPGYGEGTAEALDVGGF